MVSWNELYDYYIHEKNYTQYTPKFKQVDSAILPSEKSHLKNFIDMSTRQCPIIKLSDEETVFEIRFELRSDSLIEDPLTTIFGDIILTNELTMSGRIKTDDNKRILGWWKFYLNGAHIDGEDIAVDTLSQSKWNFNAFRTWSSTLGYTPTDQSVTAYLYCNAWVTDVSFYVDAEGEKHDVRLDNLNNWWNRDQTILEMAIADSAGHEYDGSVDDKTRLIVDTDTVTNLDGDKYTHNNYYAFNHREINGVLDSSYGVNGYYNLRIRANEGRVCGHITDDFPNNIKLIGTGNYDVDENGTTLLGVTSMQGYTLTSENSVTNKSTGTRYKGYLSTNIPLFNKRGDALNYILTGDYDNAINAEDVDDEAKFDKQDPSNSLDHKQDDYQIEGAFSSFYLLTASDEEVIHGQLMNNQEDVVGDSLLWGNSPISQITEHYWTPIDISSLHMYTGTQGVDVGGQYSIRFGRYHIKKPSDPDADYRVPCIYMMSKPQVVAEHKFTQRYGDWRDIQCLKYSLYLPYYGIIELPTNDVHNKMMRIEFTYFVPHHMLRYTIMLNGNKYKDLDASVGIDLPIVAEDSIGKAQQTFNGISGMLGNALGGALGFGGMMGTGNIGGAVLSTTSAISGFVASSANVLRDAPLNTFGNNNPTTNVNDPHNVILFIHEETLIKPNNLNNVYNYPSYHIGSVSSCSGYCEFSDVRLVGCDMLTDSEKEQVKSLLKGGIIV